jgi:hypothetical protein
VTFEQTVDYVKSLQGAMLSVSVRVPNSSGWHLTTFSGRVRDVKRSGARREAWLVWFDGPSDLVPAGSHFTLDKASFENAWQRPTESPPTLSIRHAGVVTDIDIWV